MGRVEDFKANHGKGYRLFYAAIRYHETVGWEKPYDRSQAWMWLIFEACGKKEGREILRDFGGKKRMIREEWGQLTHSQRFISEAWDWSRQRVRTFLQHLSNTNPPMITLNVAQQIDQITICNFKDYQKPKTNKQPSSSPAVAQQQPSSSPNYNTVIRKNGNTRRYADYVNMTEDEHLKLTNKFGESITADWVERLNLWKGSKGKKTNSDYLTILSWDRRENTNGTTSLTESTHDRCKRKGLI